MADLDDFFAKKDKKKKRAGGFSKANTEVLAKNLEENERREQKAEEKASPLATTEATKLAFEDNPVSGVSTNASNSNQSNGSGVVNKVSSSSPDGGQGEGGTGGASSGDGSISVASSNNKYFGIINDETVSRYFRLQGRLQFIFVDFSVGSFHFVCLNVRTSRCGTPSICSRRQLLHFVT